VGALRTHSVEAPALHQVNTKASDTTELSVVDQVIQGIRMFLGRPDPDPSLFVRIWIRIRPSTSKKVRKPLISTVFQIIFDFLSLETYVNVPSKGNKQKL
jgi:hypothetical protein